ncbi:hypothetical protein C0J52_25074 [Blattella germanica]|nr:hypothetical protein C0J52_25074 [Blattella germanica]
MLQEWKNEISQGICLGQGSYVNTILYTDDQVILAKSEDELQRNIVKLSKICKKYNLQISPEKTKVMEFQGTRPIRSKIVLENKVIQQLKHFSYLGCDISYDYDEDINNKVAKFQGMCGTINRTLRNKIRKETQLKFHKVLAVPVILYGSESWILRRKDESKLTAAEMRFLRSVVHQMFQQRMKKDSLTMGSWAPWSQWSPCTRSCGGGVAMQTRECDIRLSMMFALQPLPRASCMNGRSFFLICLVL